MHYDVTEDVSQFLYVQYQTEFFCNKSKKVAHLVSIIKSGRIVSERKKSGKIATLVAQR